MPQQPPRPAGLQVTCSGKEGPFKGFPDTPDAVAVCPACMEPIELGQFFTRIPVGCGGIAESRRLARLGLPFSPVFLMVHWACIRGDESTAGNRIILPT